ncbi:MAG: PocR ligand-binding domain-containing protein [Candidatus Limivicinus sp.]|nr:PocR ligand-binding domain-containing protein [Candidatus Limivicinus sp.]
MSRRDLDLKSILDIPLWEKIQDELARLTGTAIITIDYKGNPITKYSCRTDFCSVIREDPVFRKRCCRCDALAGLEAVRMGKPYIYLCHCGVVDAAVPVTVGNRYLGAVMFGQVRIPDGDTDAKVERLVSEVSSFQTGSESDRQDLIEMYDRLPEMEYKRIVAIADTLNAIVNYIVDRAVNSENEAMTYKFLLQNSNIQNAAAFSEIQGLKAPELEWGDFPVERELPKSSPIYPAVAYVHNHRQEMVTMNDMARLCHLSPSYFSRLFRREMGENFINYVNRIKVQWAKERLRSSNDSVVQIAQELGYMDSSYFISVFKKFEGTTPLAYRQHKSR